MDRVKDIIIRGGENISCAEVSSSFLFHTSRFGIIKLISISSCQVEAAVHEHPSVMETAVRERAEQEANGMATVVFDSLWSLGRVLT